MPNYAECTLIAVERAKAGEDPVSAWKNAAVSIFPGKKSAQEKGCPKGAFLGLCEEGFVQGIAKGRYTRSRDNKTYAIEAIRLLKARPQLRGDVNALWSLIPRHPINENGQMQVVLALWDKGLVI